MELNIEAQKQEFLTICRASIQREGLEDLLAWMSCGRSVPAFHRCVSVCEETAVPDAQGAVGGVCGDCHPVP